MIRRRGPQKVGIDLCRVADIRRRACQQLEKLWIVNNLGPLRIDEQWRERFQRLPFFVVPDRAPFAGFRGNLDGSDARSESF